MKRFIDWILLFGIFMSFGRARAEDFIKLGNNGLQACSSYCQDPSKGGGKVGECRWANWKDRPGTPTSECETIPGFLGGEQLICACSDGASGMKSGVRFPTDPAMRCSGKNPSPTECAEKRKKALALGCINREEYDELFFVGSYPVCDFDLKLMSGYCPCGCFDQSVRLLVQGGGVKFDWLTAGDITKAWYSTTIMAVESSSSLTDLRLVPLKLKIATKGPEATQLYVISTKFGDGLKLTSNHPVLTQAGRMVLAKDLNMGDVLVGSQGESVPILAITRQDAEREVVNFATDTREHLSHIIVAEGVLVGDLVWQASYVEDLNKIVIRK